ncbi:MAG: accessory gene regulator B family protein [Oscillospiraceae bacterium]|nr:accessory gene regulator B family protein [Oscillospiraceae bacterium]
MIARLSRNVSSYFIEKNIIADEDREVYEYSFEVLFSTAFSILMVAMIAVLTGNIVYTILYLTGFIPLRRVAGGFHAKNHFRCFLTLIVAYGSFLVTITVIQEDYIPFAIISCLIVSVLLVFRYAPVEDTNKAISAEDKVRLRKISRITISLLAGIISVISIFLPDIRLAFAAAIGIFTVAVSLPANHIKMKQMNRKQYKNTGKD